MQDYFLLQILDKATNAIPHNEKHISDLSEKEFDDWLKKQNFSEKKKPKHYIHLPVPEVQLEPQCNKSKVLILPLSLENNATSTGTAAIIEEFGKEFGVPCEHAKEYLPFDEQNNTFNLELARKHREFLFSLKDHKEEMLETVRILKNAEKAFDSHHNSSCSDRK